MEQDGLFSSTIIILAISVTEYRFSFSILYENKIGGNFVHYIKKKLLFIFLMEFSSMTYLNLKLTLRYNVSSIGFSDTVRLLKAHALSSLLRECTVLS